ncbi:tetratricopeptide-like helical domain-containing protein [Cavenderia fasciculata]|uniref:Tetratricopeptide-like helical domain-containing protein n=1 Tax=Cavenderia fasciculata TaxID=261658 RepID=F4PM05_CACFS|nr:tetratricopeptide-like helical domain-containing protein [Cavenderia fasciculata]EGG22708.1 tetratricopeptide-like helical domain-containing protein [Cavenderia fasciculata]|eukprot:XP_004360559.1 tetratricopeptide-like helical domain-containing protein [Cavenderia fasciculata]
MSILFIYVLSTYLSIIYIYACLKDSIFLNFSHTCVIFNAHFDIPSFINDDKTTMDVKIIIKQARDAIDKKDYKKALEICTDGLDFHNMNFNLHLFIGLCNFNLNKFKDSEDAYKNAQSITPSSPFPLRGLMDLYQKSGEGEKYIKVIKELIPHTTDAIKKRELQSKMVDHHIANQQFKEPIEMLFDMLASIQQQQQQSLETDAVTTTTTTTSSSSSSSSSINSERLKILIKLESLVYQQKQQQVKLLFENGMKEKNIPILNPAKAKVIGAPTHTPQQAQDKILIERNAYSKVLDSYNIKIYKEIIESEDLLSLIEIKQVEKVYQNYIEYYMQKRFSVVGDSLEADQKREELKSIIYQECVKMNRLLLYPFFPLETMILLLEENGKASTDTSILGISQLLTRMHPDRGLGWIGLGYYQVFHQYDQSENTRSMLEMGLAQTPNSILGNVALGKIYLEQKNHDRLKDVVRKGLDSCSAKEKENGKFYDRYNIDLHLYLAESLLITYETENAVLVLEQVLKKHPNDTQTLFTLAKLYFDHQKFDQSLGLFQKIIELESSSSTNNKQVQNLSKSMVIWIKLQQHDTVKIDQDTKDQIVTLLQNDDGYLNHFLLGLYYRLVGENDQAVQEMLKSAQKNPSYALTFSNLGLLYKDKKDMERSKKCFQKALSLDILNYDAGIQLSSIYIANEQYTLASSLYQDITARCLESRKQLNINIAKCSWAFYRLGLYQMDIGQLDNSCSNFLMALKGNPDNEQYWRGIGECYRRQIKYIASLKALKRAEELLVSSNATAPDLNYQIASLNMTLGEYKEAIIEFDLVLASLPNHLPSFKGKADCYFQLATDHLKSNYQRLAYLYLTLAEESCLKAIDSKQGDFESVWKLYGDISSHYHYLAPSSREDGGDIDYIGKLEQATKSYLRCIEIQPLNFNSLYDLSLSNYYQYIRLSNKYNQEQKEKEKEILLQRLDTLFKSSVKCITQAINHSPRQARYWNLLGVILIDKYPMQSQHAFIRSIQIDPSKSNPYNNLAMLYLQNNKIDLSNSSLFISKSNDATFISSWSIQALIHELKNDSSQSYSEYSHIEIALESDPSGEGLLSNGILCYYNGNIDRAELSLEVMGKEKDKKLNLQSNDIITLDSLSLSDNEIISYRQGGAEDDPSLSISEPIKKFILINIARVQCKLESYQQSLVTLEPYIGATKEKSLSSSHILEIVGLANHHLGNSDKAIEYLKQSVAAIKPDIINDDGACKLRKVQLLLTMATICFKTNRLKQCEQIIEKVIESDPNLENAYHLLASIYILSEEYRKATDTIKRLHNQTLHPTLQGLLILARCAILEQKFEKARTVLLKACHCFPNEISTWTWLAQFLNTYSSKDVTLSNIRQILYQQIEIQQQSLENINNGNLVKYQVEHIQLLEQLSKTFLFEISQPYSENIDNSINTTKKIIHINPNYLGPWKQLSTLYYIRALHKSDQESFENALILNQLVRKLASEQSYIFTAEEMFLLDFGLGDIYIYNSNQELFNNHHSKLMSTHKDDPILTSQLQRQLGRFDLLVQKDPLSSIANYKKSLQSNPLNLISYQELSYIYEELKYYEASYHCLNRALSIIQQQIKESNNNKYSSQDNQNQYLILVCRIVRYLILTKQTTVASKTLEEYLQSQKHQQNQQHPVILLFKRQETIKTTRE